MVQTIGRAARNAEGLVVLYADKITASMAAAMGETERRRAIQDAYNKAHGIVPKTVVKSVRELLEISKSADGAGGDHAPGTLTKREREEAIVSLEKQMREASKMLEFEYAAVLRDRIIKLRDVKA
ncbi:UvrABC system protein B [bioreactor metagenome]|uniref:UvrABC system protein B n=1 Tax=bioreactor metagenome TaxID=1076179 RepID=A0A645D042_9ZZZZ